MAPTRIGRRRVRCGADGAPSFAALNDRGVIRRPVWRCAFEGVFVDGAKV